MKKKRRGADQATKRSAAGSVALWMKDCDICASGYTRLSDNPEIQTACLRIAEIVASMTIWLLENTSQGDKRIQNELSRMIDITPQKHLSRVQWMTAIMMNLLLYGNGNSVVVPHTSEGLLTGLEPIAPVRVSFMPEAGSYADYRIVIDGRPRDPEDVMHFVYNPDPIYPWMGRGVTTNLKDIARNLKQAQLTENAFMSSEWKPSIIVKVDGLTEEFFGPEGREKLLQSYINPNTPGEPWMIPADAFAVEQVKPLTLNDLAIKDTIEIDKRTVASVLGVPPFVVGVGDFNREEWNNFIQTKIRSFALIIQQEMTRALIISPKWYLAMNYWSLLDYDPWTMSTTLLNGADRGFINGDEWRDRMHMPPVGLTEYKVLENYIPYDKSGDQKKLKGNGGNDE